MLAKMSPMNQDKIQYFGSVSKIISYYIFILCEIVMVIFKHKTPWSAHAVKLVGSSADIILNTFLFLSFLLFIFMVNIRGNGWVNPRIFCDVIIEPHFNNKALRDQWLDVFDTFFYGITWNRSISNHMMQMFHL